MSLKRRLLVLFLALWLPMSVVVAGTMSTAMSGPASQSAPAGLGEGCAQHADQGMVESGNCYSCSFCQFACTALMSIAAPAKTFFGAWLAVEFNAPNVPLPIPELLQRPPHPHAA